MRYPAAFGHLFVFETHIDDSIFPSVILGVHSRPAPAFTFLFDEVNHTVVDTNRSRFARSGGEIAQGNDMKTNPDKPGRFHVNGDING